ncbi:MAG: dihydrolipoyl dehydrogenase [Gemmataceae bacterium]|nr:dihydrolipoyl dehydrogenase [Gemmataceae bacterium]
MPDRFDLVVLGAGPGGYVAAIRAAQLGMKVATIDSRATLGGTCLNVGCIPSKALLDSSELMVLARSELSRHGIGVQNVTLDLAAMMARKDRVVKGLVDGIAHLFKKHRISHFQGTGRLTGQGRVTVTGSDGKSTTLEGAALLLATGSDPAALPTLPFDGTHIVGSTEALSFDRVPAHLIVVGAGYIGLELGSVWARLGAKVTVLEFLPRILGPTDAEIAALVQKSLTKQGLTFHLDTEVLDAKLQGGQVLVRAQSQGKEASFHGDRVLVAVGRRPRTAGLGLEEAGVVLTDRGGFVKVNETFQTSAAGVYAIGDLIGNPMLAHKAMEEGVAFAEQRAGQAVRVNYAAIPSVAYTWPEVSSVGLTEEQVKETGKPYRVGKFPFAASGRARSMGETEGLVKVLADAGTDRLLGVHILGPRASELIAEAVTALEFAGSAEDVARICHAHPTLSEAVAEAARAAFAGMPLHA